MSKVILNIVYSPQTGPDHIVFQNHLGEIWHSAKYHPNKHNIGMGWYSLRDPKPQDSIFVVEPYCVLPMDYRPDFLAKFRYIFTWATKALTQPELKNKVIEVNHPSCKDLYYKQNQMEAGWLPWKERSDEVVIIANNKTSTHNSELYSLRLQLADLIHQKSKMRVSWYGQEPPLKKPYVKGLANSKKNILTKMKFSLCTENSYDPMYTYNYFTEKMPEVWASGCVPIYMGCYNIDSFGFPPNSYIDLRNYITKKGNNVKINEEAFLKALHNYNGEKYAAYRNTVLQQILIPEKLFHIISHHRVYKKMIQTFAGKIG